MSNSLFSKGGSLVNKLLVLSVGALAATATVKYSGIVDSVGDAVNEYVQDKSKATGVDRFTGFWVPTEYKGNYTPDKWVIGLVYLKEDNVIGEFEGPGEEYKRKGRWLEIKIFDYDEGTGVLTIDFDKNDVNAQGTATFHIDDNDHLFMTNSGGTYEFFRATDENMKYEPQNIDMPNIEGNPFLKLIPPGGD